MWARWLTSLLDQAEATVPGEETPSCPKFTWPYKHRELGFMLSALVLVPMTGPRRGWLRIGGENGAKKLPESAAPILRAQYIEWN
jgi:hypothetical protein